MQGVINDEKGSYVNAAIIRLIKFQDHTDREDQTDEAEAVTYAETDEKGRFVIQDLNPEEKYIIEILLEKSDSNPEAEKDSDDKKELDEVKDSGEINDELFDLGINEENDDLIEETDDLTEEAFDQNDAEDGLDFYEEDRLLEYDIVDSLTNKKDYSSTVKDTVTIHNIYKPVIDLNDKPYLMKNNLW